MNTKLIVSILVFVGLLIATAARAQVAIGNGGVTFPDGSVQTTAFPFIQPPPPDVDDLLVVAYTNVDGIPGYSVADRLIAAIVDVNGNNTVDNGDEVATRLFPYLNASVAGVFLVHTRSIDNVDIANATRTVVISGEYSYEFADNFPQGGGIGDYYFEAGPTTSCPGSQGSLCDSSIQISEISTGEDQIQINCGGNDIDRDAFFPWLCPSFPSNMVVEFQTRPGDQGFIDVDILY